jgi:hypothetical protein
MENFVYCLLQEHGQIIKIYSSLNVCVNDLIKCNLLGIELRDQISLIEFKCKLFGRYFFEANEKGYYIAKVKVHNKDKFNYNIP